MAKFRRIFPYITRSLMLVLAVLAVLPLAGGGRFQLFLPALSPYVMIVSAIALRSVVWVSLLALPVLLMSLWKGRWFCRNFCPAGLCFDTAGKLGGIAGIKKRPVRTKLNLYLLLFALGGAVAGYPVFIWLDPLVIFNGFAGVWVEPFSWANAAMGAGFTAILLLSIFRPYLWCYGICPLGATQQWLGRLRHVVRGKREGERGISHAEDAEREGARGKGQEGRGKREEGTGRAERPRSAESGPSGQPYQTRRGVLSLIAGSALGLFFVKLLRRKNILRPPGSVSEEKFNALCARCGNCMRACPEHIIHAAGTDAGVDGLLTPFLKIQPGYCSEFCNKCNEVCPTGAIAMMPLSEKRCVAIGTAVVRKGKCLAWEEGEYCMVCDEYCPFKAIHGVDKDGVKCPEVDPEICRGCGLCQKECPALEVAIVIEPRPQRKLAHVEVSGW